MSGMYRWFGMLEVGAEFESVQRGPALASANIMPWPLMKTQGRISGVFALPGTNHPVLLYSSNPVHAANKFRCSVRPSGFA